MTTANETQVKTEATTTSSKVVRVAWRPVVSVAVGVFALLLAFSNSYSYHADELYFRMLGERGFAWGYVDQPPLLPALVRLSSEVFGDSLWGIRVPAAVCAAVVVLLCGMIAAELGGTRRAQVLTAFCLGTSTMVLSFGHWILTTSVDTVAWCAVLLFVLRALLRADGRWWIAVGVVCGIALYAKYIVLLLPVSVLVGLLVVGPRSVFRDLRLYLGMVLALVIGAPNLVYQVLNDFPQLRMAQALGSTDGEANRSMFATNLILELGPILVVIWLIGLYKLFRVPAWRPVRSLGVGYLAATVAAFMIEGGRPDYTGGFLLALFAAGCVAMDRWLGSRKVRLAVVSFGLAITTAFQLYLGLPVLPQNDLATMQLASMQLESVGWPALVDQVAKVYGGLSEQDRARAVLVAENFGEAGALDRFGGSYRLPQVYSGHNELYNWGPPPDTADVIVAVGLDDELLGAGFASCQVVAKVDNGIGVDNPEQGMPITVCHGRKASWVTLWPAYHHLNAYL